MILQIILGILIILQGYIIRNMFRREKRYEELIKDQASYMRRAARNMKLSYEKLIELDRIGAFQSDDETGEFFTILKSSFEDLSRESVDVNYGETEEN